MSGVEQHTSPSRTDTIVVDGTSSPSPHRHHRASSIHVDAANTQGITVVGDANSKDAHNSYIRSNQDVEIGALRTQLAFYVGYFNRHQKDIIRRSCSPENIDTSLSPSQNNGDVQSETIFDNLHTLRLALHLAEDRVESLRRAQAATAVENKRGRDELLKEIDLLSDENDSMLEEQQALQLRIKALEGELEEARLVGGGEPIRATMAAVRRGATAVLQMTEAAARSALENAWCHESLDLVGCFYEGQAYLPNGGGGIPNPKPSALLCQVLWFKGMPPAPGSVSAPTTSSLSAMVAWGTKEWVTLASYQPPKPTRSASSPTKSSFHSSSLHAYIHGTANTTSATPQQHHSPAGVGTRRRLLQGIQEEEAKRKERAAEDVQYYVDSKTKGHLLGPDSPMYEPYYSLAHMTPIPLDSGSSVRRSASPHLSPPPPPQQQPATATRTPSSSPVQNGRNAKNREASPQVKSTPLPNHQYYTTNTQPSPSASPIVNRPAATPGRHSVINPMAAATPQSPSYSNNSYSPPHSHYQSKKEHVGVRDLRIEALMKVRLDAAAAVREAQWGTRTAARINEGVQRCELDSRASQSISRTEEMIEGSLRRYRAELAQKEEAASPSPAKEELPSPVGPIETEEERAERILREKEEEELKEKLFERVTKAKNELLVLERISRETGDPTMKQRFQRQMKAMHEYLLEDDFATGVSVVLEQEDAAERSAMMSADESSVANPSLSPPPPKKAAQPPVPSVVVHKQPFMLSASDAKKFREASTTKEQPTPKKGAFTSTAATSIDTPRRRGGGTSPSRSPKRRPNGVKSAFSPGMSAPSPAASPKARMPPPRPSTSPEGPMSGGHAIPSDVSVATTDTHVRALLREAQDELQREGLRLRSSTSCVPEDGEEASDATIHRLSPIPLHSSS